MEDYKLQVAVSLWREYTSKMDEASNNSNKTNNILQKELDGQNEINEQMKKKIQELIDNLTVAEKRNADMDDAHCCT